MVNGQMDCCSRLRGCIKRYGPSTYTSCTCLLTTSYATSCAARIMATPLSRLEGCVCRRRLIPLLLRPHQCPSVLLLPQFQCWIYRVQRLELCFLRAAGSGPPAIDVQLDAIVGLRLLVSFANPHPRTEAGMPSRTSVLGRLWLQAPWSGGYDCIDWL